MPLLAQALATCVWALAVLRRAPPPEFLDACLVHVEHMALRQAGVGWCGGAECGAGSLGGLEGGPMPTCGPAEHSAGRQGERSGRGKIDGEWGTGEQKQGRVHSSRGLGDVDEGAEGLPAAGAAQEQGRGQLGAQAPAGWLAGVPGSWPSPRLPRYPRAKAGQGAVHVVEQSTQQGRQGAQQGKQGMPLVSEGVQQDSRGMQPGRQGRQPGVQGAPFVSQGAPRGSWGAECGPRGALLTSQGAQQGWQARHAPAGQGAWDLRARSDTGLGPQALAMLAYALVALQHKPGPSFVRAFVAATYGCLPQANPQVGVACARSELGWEGGGAEGAGGGCGVAPGVAERGKGGRGGSCGVVLCQHTRPGARTGDGPRVQLPGVIKWGEGGSRQGWRA